MIVARGAAITAVVVALLLAGTSARFLTDAELENEVCNSQVHGTISRVSVVTPPANPIDLIVIKEPANKYEITCLKVFEVGPSLLESQQDLCQDPPVLSLCKASVENSTSQQQWVCEDISATYISAPRSSRTEGGFNKPEFYYKITWQPINMGSACFPRDLTTQFVGTEKHKVESNLGAVIAFIIIACLVGALVLFFATYQLRKQLRKFWKRELMTARRMPNEAVDPAAAPEASTLYGDDVVVPKSGALQTTTIEGVTLTSKPLPKKWYERYNYDERQDAQQQQEVPVQRDILPESIEITQNTAVPSSSPMRTFTSYDEEPVAVNGSTGIGAGGGEEEWYKMCSDCRLIIDGSAPKLCHMTGLRHY